MQQKFKKKEGGGKREGKVEKKKEGRGRVKKGRGREKQNGGATAGWNYAQKCSMKLLTMSYSSSPTSRSMALADLTKSMLSLRSAGGMAR